MKQKGPSAAPITGDSLRLEWSSEWNHGWRICRNRRTREVILFASRDAARRYARRRPKARFRIILPDGHVEEVLDNRGP